MGSKKDILVLEEHCCLKKIIFDQGVGWLVTKYNYCLKLKWEK